MAPFHLDKFSEILPTLLQMMSPPFSFSERQNDSTQGCTLHLLSKLGGSLPTLITSTPTAHFALGENGKTGIDRTLFEFEKRISHTCSSLVAKKRRFSWVDRDNERNSEAIESMVESEP